MSIQKLHDSLNRYTAFGEKIRLKMEVIRLIAVTARSEQLNGQMDGRFGRCKRFILYDKDTGEFETYDNPARGASSGAGVNAAQFLVEWNVETLLTGNVGPKAMRTLQAAGIQVYADVSGTVEKAIEDYKSGRLKPAKEASVDAHFGAGGGRGRGGGGKGGNRDNRA